MMRITAYADRLTDDLDLIDWPDKVRTMQRNWIGKSVGAHILFATAVGEPIEVFTTRPDTVFGATYMVLAPEHPLVERLTVDRWPDDIPSVWTDDAADPVAAVAAYQQYAAGKSELDRQADAKQKSGVFTGSYATNPATGAQIPVFVADYVLMGYGTGAIMAVPGQDERDWEFAEAFELPIVRTVRPPADFTGDAYVGEGPAINSANDDGLDLDGRPVAEAKAATIAWLEARGAGRAATTYRLRDWLFSRQRYWGEPFPIVYDETGLPIGLPDSMLPLELPDTTDFAPRSFDPEDVDSEPEPPLGRLTDWVNVELDLGDGPRRYTRETSTMPNWAGSCWYELRYADPVNADLVVDPVIENYWMGPTLERPLGGVQLYVGGVEHAVLHLLYARFWHKVLYDLGYVTSAEPFHRLVNQGYVQAYAYTDSRGAYVQASEVLEKVQGTEITYWYDGEEVEREYGKMGKSLKNVTTPDDMYEAYGADTLRLFEMFTGPLEQSRPWDTKAVVGSFRLLQRIWRVVLAEETGTAHVSEDVVPAELNRLLHRTIAAVREGLETLHFNTSIARLTELNNALTQSYPDGGAPRAVVEPLVLMLAPLAPHAAEELWSRLGHDTSLVWHPFPEADPVWLAVDTVEVPVQVNGKLRSVIVAPADADAATLEALARADQKVVAALAGREIKRVVAVPGRLINFVV
jgi:leucyl-tRNA synthetase